MKTGRLRRELRYVGCLLGRHQWNRLDKHPWRVINQRGPGHVLAVCRVCFKREVGP